jgi:hypothetical protein
MHTYSRRTVGNGDFCTVRVGKIKLISKYVSAAKYKHTYSRRTLGIGDLCTDRVRAIKRRGKQVKVKVTLRLTVSPSVSLGVEPHLRLITRYLLLFDSYGLVFLWRPL